MIEFRINSKIIFIIMTKFKTIALQGKRNILQNQCLFFESLPSTNSWIIENIQNFDHNGLLVACAHQTQGKGRRGNVWITPKGKCLTFSAVYKLKRGLFLPQILSLAAGLAIYKYLLEFDMPDMRLKWPNDILVGNKKICGILCEKLQNKGEEVVVIGIGLNVNLIATDIPIQLQKKITSIAMQLKRNFTIFEVLSQITQKLDNVLSQLEIRGKTFIIKEWETCTNILGKDITFWQHKKLYYGSTIKLDRTDGSLVIKKLDGTIQNLYAGDIQMVRCNE